MSMIRTAVKVGEVAMKAGSAAVKITGKAVGAGQTGDSTADDGNCARLLR